MFLAPRPTALVAALLATAAAPAAGAAGTHHHAARGHHAAKVHRTAFGSVRHTALRLAANAAPVANADNASPDEYFDVGAVRGLPQLTSGPARPAKLKGQGKDKARRAKSTTTTTTTQPTPTQPTATPSAPRSLPAGKSVDLRILVVTADGSQPVFSWFTSSLKAEGVPFDVMTASTTDLTSSALQVGDTHGRYDAIVLETDGLGYQDPVTGWVSAFSKEEWMTLQAYERDFGVRELDLFAWPNPSVGLDWGAGGFTSNLTGTLTGDGAAAFPQLVSNVPVPDGDWAYTSTVLAGSGFKTLVSEPNGTPMVGTVVRADGVEQMVDTANGNRWQLHSQLLLNGMLDWVTGGVHLGQYRNYLNVDVDDVFMADNGWNTTAHTDYPDDNILPDGTTTDIRMTAADVTRAVQWQKDNGFTMNMLFNGSEAVVGGRTADPLTTALLQNKAAFRWTSHTWDHLYMAAPLSATDMQAQIKNNIDFAMRNKLPSFNATELVTGEHSGIKEEDANLQQALAATGIKWVGADASLSAWATQRPFGTATTVPRHPSDVYYNVSTVAQQIDEYNTIYAGQIGTQTWDQYVARQVAQILPHMLLNDPDPTYVHQSNLAADGIFYKVFGAALSQYRSLVKAPVTQASMSDLGMTMQRQAAWQSALDSGAVSATLSSAGVTVHNTAGAITVPVTGTSVGTGYAGTRSGWQSAPAGDTRIGL